MKCVYGVDPDKEVTTVDARDALVECFTQAHAKELEMIKEYYSADSEEEYTKLKQLNVEMLIRSFFKKVGGDYEVPTKESLLSVCEKLAEYAANFRTKKVIEEHYGEMVKLIERI